VSSIVIYQLIYTISSYKSINFDEKNAAFSVWGKAAFLKTSFYSVNAYDFFLIVTSTSLAHSVGHRKSAALAALH
jgi:hypothetical protein